MDVLIKTIKSLSKKEIINYKIQANRAFKGSARKDITLFDLLKNTKYNDADTLKIKTKLYGNDVSNNTYNKLQERLLNDINNSLVQFYYHETDANYIYSELSLYKVFLARNEYDVAFYHLQKAEKKATSISDFLLLDVIYSEFIQLSTNYGKQKPQFYLEKRNLNFQKLSAIRKLDETLSIVIYELDKNQTFGTSNKQNIKQLDDAIKYFETDNEFKNNVVFKSKLFNGISQLLISKKDFTTLEQYAIRTFNEFERKRYFTKSNHEFKLQILRYICNALFFNGKHKTALEYIELLHKALKEYQKFLYDKHIFFYYNALANNYSVINPQKAIVVLNEARKNLSIINHPSHLGYIYFNLAGAYFGLKQPKVALKNIISIVNHPVFASWSDAFKIQVLIFEVLLRIELNDFNYAQKQIIFIRKTYLKSLQNSGHQADHEFLKLLVSLIQKYDFKKTNLSQKAVSRFLNNNSLIHSSQLIDYKEWLNEHLK